MTTIQGLPVTVRVLPAALRAAAVTRRALAAPLHRIPERYRRPLAWTALLCSPTVVLAASMGVTAARGETVWTPTGANAGDQAWLNTLAAPVAAGADGATMQLPPTAAVLPQGGDLGTLTTTQGTDDGIGTPSYGDSTQTARLTSSGIPVRVLQAYAAAASIMARTDPGCRLHWSLVAGIGRVESNHGRFGGAVVTTSGRVTPAILGPRLDGSTEGWATIRDTDAGRYDGDTAFDRAVGPMQFLPGTWRSFGADADADGSADPQDVDDAALGTARYLCAGDGDLARSTDRWNAVLRYNHSTSYAALVLGLADSYAAGRAAPVPAPPSGVRPPTSGDSGSPVKPTLPPTPAVTVEPAPPAPTRSTGTAPSTAPSTDLPPTVSTQPALPSPTTASEATTTPTTTDPTTAPTTAPSAAATDPASTGTGTTSASSAPEPVPTTPTSVQADPVAPTDPAPGAGPTTATSSSPAPVAPDPAAVTGVTPAP